MKMKIILALLLISFPAFAQDRKHPVIVTVLSSQTTQNTAVVAWAPTPARTDCNSTVWGTTTVGTVDTECTTTTGSSGGAAVVPDGYSVSMTVKIYGQTRTLLCKATWALSRCTAVNNGEVWGRWDNKRHTRIKLLVQFAGENNPKEVKYDVQ